MTTVTLHPTPSSTVDAITDDPIMTDRILRALREHYVIVRRFGGTEDAYTSERTDVPRRAATYGDEPCRCGHPESAHTELGCGAPTDYASGWAIDSPCTCGAYRIADDPDA